MLDEKRHSDPALERRIREDIVVDAFGSEEQAMGWYYYLEGKLRFPFRAACIASMATSPLLKGETADVIRMAPEAACLGDMLVLIRWQDRSMAVPLSQLLATDGDEATVEAIADWHYWLDRGHTF